MEVTETRSEGLSREFQFVVPAGDLDERLTRHLESIRGQVNMKGFRPGKVPVAHLKKTMAGRVMGEIIQETVSEVSNKALHDRELRPAQTPKIDFEGSLDPVVQGKTDLTFTMAVELMPDFQPVEAAKLELERPISEATDGDVQEALESLAEQQKVFKSRAKSAKAREGDQVRIDFVGTIDGKEFAGGGKEDFLLVLGSGGFIPGFEDQLVGVTADEERDVNVQFPKEYPARELADKLAIFKVTVHEVSEPQKAEIDDELAKKLGLKDLAQLKEALIGRIEQDLARLSRERLKRNLLDALDETHSFELPQGMVEQEFDRMWAQMKEDQEREGQTFEDRGETENKAREEYRLLAERRVRLGLVLAEVGRLNNIQVSDEELSRALHERARQFPGQEQQIYDFYAKNLEAMEQVRAPLFEDKVVDFIAELANVKDKKVTREELMADPDDAVIAKKRVVEARPQKSAKKVAKKSAAKTAVSSKSGED